MEQSEHRPAEAEPRSLRTHLVHRPREGRFSAGVELNILLSRCYCIGLLAPAELGTVNPHPVQDDGEASGQGNDRSCLRAGGPDACPKP